MLTSVRVLETLFFAAISFFPYYILLLHPFWNRRMFSVKVTIIVLMLAFALDASSYLYVVYGGNVTVSHAIHIAIAMIYGNFMIDDKPGKVTLTVLILVNFYVIINIISIYFEGLLFPGLTMEYYRWSRSLCTVFVSSIFLSLDALYSVKVYAPTLRHSEKNIAWRYLWIIPAIFLLIWYTIMHSSKGNDLTVLRDFTTVTLMLAIALGGFLVDFVIARMISEQSLREQHEKELLMAELRQRQFQDMNKRIDDARRARHDLRHHLNVAMAYLNDGKIEELREFLGQYQDALPNDTIAGFCRNYTVNAIITYYKQRNDEREISYHVSVNIPEDLEVSDNDLCVVFGNTLENASDAALEAKQAGMESKITLESMVRGDVLMISVQNTYAGDPDVDSEGRFRSTKHRGYGIGIESVQEKVEKYNGHMDIQYSDHTFIVTILMYLPHKNV